MAYFPNHTKICKSSQTSILEDKDISNFSTSQLNMSDNLFLGYTDRLMRVILTSIYLRQWR